MSAVYTVLCVARSNVAERMAGRSHQRLGRPPQPDDDLVAAIKAVIAVLILIFALQSASIGTSNMP